MKSLVYSINHEIKDAYVGCGDYTTLYIQGRVYAEKKKFLWIRWTKYTYTINVPYIENPFYGGEFGTNRTLHTIASMIEQKLIDKIIELKEK